MFAIASPQTVPLTTPGEDGQPISLTFHTGTKSDPHDVSMSTIDVLMPNGDVHVLTFNTRGQLVDVTFVEHVDEADPDHEADAETDFDNPANALATAKEPA